LGGFRNTHGQTRRRQKTQLSPPSFYDFAQDNKLHNRLEDATPRTAFIGLKKMGLLSAAQLDSGKFSDLANRPDN
jgi:hypothetical protein